MSLPVEHELHARRSQRNVAVGLVLSAFVILVFAITVVKMSSGHVMEAFDHAVRPSLIPAEE